MADVVFVIQTDDRRGFAPVSDRQLQDAIRAEEDWYELSSRIDRMLEPKTPLWKKIWRVR